MAQHQYHCLLILLSSACLFNQILAQSGSISFTDPFNSTYTTSNPYKPDIYFDFTTKHAVLYQIIYNTTDASFVDLSNMAVTYTNIPVPTIVIPEGSVNTTYNANGNNVAVFGQVIDPCVFAAPGGRATLTFNASTDAVSGEITSVIGAIEIATIQNATAFEYSSPAPLQMTGDVNNNFQASRYYFLDLNANGSENFGLEATSSEDIFLSIAGLGNCPTFQFTDKSPYWSGSVAANQSVTTSVVASNETSFVWVLVTSNKPATVTLTWTYLGSTPVSDPTPASEPTSASEPTAQTPNQKTDELPTWATAVLVVFGIVIAILLIVVIVMCVKNRRRSTYQGV